MSVWSRLGKIISSYLNDSEGETAERLGASRDPDLDEAYEELNDFLGGKETKNESRYSENKFSWQDNLYNGFGSAGGKLPPEGLRADFECLGVPFGANDETCKAAYKKLLKIHHPDRHAGHEGDYKKATEKTAKINAAYDRIEKWRHGK